MKSRHLAAMETLHQRRHWRIFWVFALLLLGLASGAVFAQDETDPPARVGHLSFRQGGVVFAPQGEEDWTELPQNRPITAGDRLWTDRGARAEVQLGSATLHVDGESHLGVSDLDDGRAQFILQQGTVNLRVRELLQGENVEIDTPNVALRALQPGDYRVDVDAQTGQTRVVVHGGTAAVFGEGGESIHLGAGQTVSFAGRFLAQVQGHAFRQDEFAQWAAGRNRQEDQSIAARHVPRGVVGATQLDQHGSWSHDPNHGTVWYPTVVVENWAPYRYGHWTWIAPWGWTWVDDAPWGFAPFHYGRWTMIGQRWAWVPGRLAARPVYSPALVVFLGGGGSRISIGSGPGVGWYPLAPGEAWWPVYRTSPRYVSHANVHINLNAYPRHYQNHHWRHRHTAVTAVREDDFRRGRPVYRHWQPLAPQTIGSAMINVVPVRPEPRHRSEPRHAPRLHTAVPTQVQPAVVQPSMAQPSVAQPSMVQPGGGQPRLWRGRELPPDVRDQVRAQREQHRLQVDAERNAREQQRAAEHARQQQDVRVQREQLLRQQQEQAARIQAQQREAAAHRAQQEQRERMHQERSQQREAWRQQREERREQREQPQVQPAPGFPRARPFMQVQPQQPQPQQATPIGRERGGERGGERRWMREAEGDGGGRGRGHGGGHGWQRG